MRIHSIFESISGEAGPVINQGAWTTFIRTQECNCQCSYCDTKDALKPGGGMELSIAHIINHVFTKNVLVTGGEPLIWEEMPQLLDLLAMRGHIVQVETNGTQWPLPRLGGVGYAVDIKCPCSGMQDSMPSPKDLRSTLILEQHQTQPIDFKFVVKDMEDIAFASKYIAEIFPRAANSRFIFSPMNAETNPELIQTIIKTMQQVDSAVMDRLIISLQLHKILNLP